MEVIKAIGKFIWNIISYIGNAIVWIVGIGMTAVLYAFMAVVVAPILALVETFKDDVSPNEAFGDMLDMVGDYLKSIVNILDN